MFLGCFDRKLFKKTFGGWARAPALGKGRVNAKVKKNWVVVHVKNIGHVNNDA